MLTPGIYICRGEGHAEFVRAHAEWEAKHERLFGGIDDEAWHAMTDVQRDELHAQLGPEPNHSQRCVWALVGPAPRSRTEAAARKPCAACGSTGSTLPLATFRDGKGREHTLAIHAVVEDPEKGQVVHGLHRDARGAGFSVYVVANEITRAQVPTI